MSSNSTGQQNPQGHEAEEQQQSSQQPEGRIQLADDAPPVNLSLFVVENKGVEVSNDPIQGRIVVATRDFGKDEWNEAILREAPALICEQQDYLDYMETFLDLPVEVQVGILDLYFQPLDSPMGQSLLEPAKLLYVLGVLEDLTVIHQLLSIYMTNAHQYKQTKSALSLFGSKFSHSCNPNVGYSSTSGLMEYRILKPIQRGEQVTFSYLADLYETPTNERRKLLQQTKTFFCQCERCMSPDYSRCIQCPNNCSNIVPCQYNIDQVDTNHHHHEGDNFQEGDPYWDCPHCGMLETPYMLRVEQVIENLLITIERDVHTKVKQKVDFLADNNQRSRFSPKMLQDLAVRCQQTLSLTHHLTVKALRLWVNVATNYAFVQTTKMMVRHHQALQESIHNSRTHALLRASIHAGFQLVLACECVAANCKGCYNAVDNEDGKDTGSDAATTPRQHLLLRIAHDPHYDRATPMNHFCEDILQLPLYWWPPLAVTMMERYYPLLKSKFYKLGRIESCLNSFWQKTVCLECGSHWENPKWNME